MAVIKDHSLYFVCTEEYGNGRSAAEAARDAVRGGADIVQMREKHKSGDELARLGKELARLCEGSGRVFIVNDDPALAAEIGADGVHLGQEDMKRSSIKSAREMLGPGKIIGVSTHSLEEFELANNGDVDYIAFGPIFPTGTKDYSIGTSGVERVLKAARKPVVLIGGITLDNVDTLLDLGAKNVAVIRDMIRADDIAGRAKAFKEKILRQPRGLPQSTAIDGAAAC